MIVLDDHQQDLHHGEQRDDGEKHLRVAAGEAYEAEGGVGVCATG